MAPAEFLHHEGFERSAPGLSQSTGGRISQKLGGRCATNAALENPKRDARTFARRLHLVCKAFLRQIPDAPAERDGTVRRLRRSLEPSHEGRDAARHPGLRPVVKDETEGAPRALEPDGHPLRNVRNDLARIVAKPEDQKHDPSLVDTRHRERMKRLSLGRGKDELTGKNTSGKRRLDHPPGGGALARRLDDRAFFAKLRAGTSEEQDQGGDAARNRDDEVEPAERHHEVGRVHQAHAVQRETEKDDREHLVELEPVRVAKRPHDSQKAEDEHRLGKPLGQGVGDGPERIPESFPEAGVSRMHDLAGLGQVEERQHGRKDRLPKQPHH